jgi:hypothetical protein
MSATSTEITIRVSGEARRYFRNRLNDHVSQLQRFIEASARDGIATAVDNYLTSPSVLRRSVRFVPEMGPGGCPWFPEAAERVPGGTYGARPVNRSHEHQWVLQGAGDQVVQFD